MEGSRRSNEALLPPGFRFHPTDEELIECYLIKKVQNNNFSVRAIGDVDLNKNEPWELPDKAKMGEKEWYFFTLRDRKYPTGMRTNRATEAGYWKATGKDRDINRTSSAALVGAKKTLVFYRGRAPKGVKTNWIMHEYRLEGEAAYLHNSRTSKDSEWVVCRIFEKSPGGKKGLYKESSVLQTTKASSSRICHELDMDHSSLPPLLESPHLDCSTATTGDSSLLKSINLPPLASHSGANFLKFPTLISSSTYDQPPSFEHEEIHARCNVVACKLEPSTSSFQQQQQQVYNGVIPWMSCTEQSPAAYNISTGSNNACETPGLTEILESTMPRPRITVPLPVYPVLHRLRTWNLFGTTELSLQRSFPGSTVPLNIILYIP